MSTSNIELIYSRKDIIHSAIKQFYELYQDRPVKDNIGGMLSPHLFNTWFLLKNIKPKIIIESGVWRGLGTWVMENACPDAKIISIDIDYSNLKYRSDKVTYLTNDIRTYDWNSILEEFYAKGIKKEEIVVFLDDHQNFLDRLEFLNNLGLSLILYEDNYPLNQGDCLSPKKILSQQDYVIDKAGSRRYYKNSIVDLVKFEDFVEEYIELPPIFKTDKTRWGDEWSDDKYPTKSPLLENTYSEEFPLFYKEAPYYTWICLMRLRNVKV